MFFAGIATQILIKWGITLHKKAAINENIPHAQTICVAAVDTTVPLCDGCR